MTMTNHDHIDKDLVWKHVVELLMRWSPLGLEDRPNGTRLIGRAPHVAPLAWLHQLFSPLTDSELAQLEAKLGKSLPKELNQFFRLSNGLKAFSDALTIFGLPRSNTRGPAIREPYDLALETLHTRHLPGILCIGGLGDDFVYYKDGPDGGGSVLACRKGNLGSPVNEWPSFWAMLKSETDRLATQFDAAGRRMKQ